MNTSSTPLRWHLLVLGSALAVAWLAAADHAGAWNDGSRLATVESLVDRHTWAIDDSVFVSVPPPQPGRPTPYRRDDALLMSHGTLDKLRINGHYYSDKSPTPALLLAGEYVLWRAADGCAARDGLDGFCKWLTFGSSGLAYALAVWCVFRLGGVLRLPLRLRLGLTASFAFCTVALAYARYVNNHILLLAVTAALLVELVRLAEGPAAQTAGRLLGLGALAGLAYTIDLGAGPVLCAGAAALVVWRCRSVGKVALFAAAALPWLVLHHALNYSLGGTFKPANAMPEYFDWPGCPFVGPNLTGAWNHPSAWHFLGYAVELLIGKKGFLFHNLPLLMALPAAWVLLRRREGRAEALLCTAWAAGVWLLYAAASTNASGVCCSVRWFVPLLAPGWYLLAVFLRDHPTYRGDFLVVSLWGGVMGALTAWGGAWMPHMVPGYWILLGAAWLHWCWHAAHRHVVPRKEKAQREGDDATEPLAA